MTDQPQTGDASREGRSAQIDAQELARRVAERVWQLWREELRHERERRAPRTRE